MDEVTADRTGPINGPFFTVGSNVASGAYVATTLSGFFVPSAAFQRSNSAATCFSVIGWHATSRANAAGGPSSTATESDAQANTTFDMTVPIRSELIQAVRVTPIQPDHFRYAPI